MCDAAREHAGKPRAVPKIRTRLLERLQVGFIVKGPSGCGLTHVEDLTLVLAAHPQ